MKKPINLSASVLDRLRNITKKQDFDYNFLLLRYIQERFFPRLAHLSHLNRFVLTGGFLPLAYNIDLLTRGCRSLHEGRPFRQGLSRNKGKGRVSLRREKSQGRVLFRRSQCIHEIFVLDRHPPCESILGPAMVTDDQVIMNRKKKREVVKRLRHIWGLLSGIQKMQENDWAVKRDRCLVEGSGTIVSPSSLSSIERSTERTFCGDFCRASRSPSGR